jgi:hypothetical protein
MKFISYIKTKKIKILNILQKKYLQHREGDINFKYYSSLRINKLS